MRKLIEIDDDASLICDNPQCDYTTETRFTPQEATDYINKPCPKCGKNLLTFDDFINWVMLINRVRRVNKWFGWTSLFIPKNKYRKGTFSTHEKISVQMDKAE